MKHTPHHRTHWIAVAVVAGLALLAFEAAGQQSTNNMSPNAEAVFQGRPLMAGAQAGLGAMAGPPQGGIGLQGSEGAGLNLRRPHVIEQQVNPLPPVACADLPRVPGEQPLCLPDVVSERFDRRLANLGIDAEQRGRM